MSWKLVGAAAMALAVAACGTQPQERTTGGAAAGAATGAGIGALGGPVGALAGAAIGAGAGAVTGATTEPSTLNLGEPPWSNPQARVPLVDEGGSSSGRRASSRSGRDYSSSNVREAQRELNQRGFSVGSVDGMWGPQTSRAVMNFQQANNLEPTGRLDSRTMQALNISGRAGSSAQMRGDRDRAYMGGGAVGNTGTGTGTMSSGSGGSTGTSGSSTAGSTGPRTNTTTGTGLGNPGTVGGGGIGSSTTSTGPGGTSGVGSGNQPGTGGTSQPR